MAGKCQTSAAQQTKKFVYSEAVNRAVRQRCHGLAATASTTTTTDDDGGTPDLPPELLLAVVQSSGEVDFSVVSGKTAGRLANDADTTPAAAAPDDVDYEISNIAEIYREISRAVEQVRQRSAANDATTTQRDRPTTRSTAAAASKSPSTVTTDDKNKIAGTVKSPQQASVRTTRKDADRRQKDGKKVQFGVTGE